MIDVSQRQDKPLTVLAWPEGGASEANPYTRLMYQAFRLPLARICSFRPLFPHINNADVFHLQWPEGIFEGRLGGSRSGAWLKAKHVLRAAIATRKRGGIVALTAHNLSPHGSLSRWQQRLYSRFHRQLLGQTDLLIGLSESGLRQFVAQHAAAESAEHIVIPHPHYRDCYPPVPEREAARTALGLRPGAIVIGMIGSVRRSKGIPEAIRAFRAVARPDEQLLVAGTCDDTLWTELTAARDGDVRIVLYRGWLSDSDIVSAFGASDICFINQAGTLNSGTALLALSLDRPVIAPDVGTLPDLRATVGNAWMELVPVPLVPNDLRRAIDQLRAYYRRPRPTLESLDPTYLSESLLAAFHHSLRARSESC